MKNVLIVAPFCSVPSEPHFNRFLYLADLLSRNSFSVTLVTSRFRHADKKYREYTANDSSSFKIVLIDEPGYKKNISLFRVYSHYIFCKKFAEWFEKNNTFDLIYSAYPLIETNKIVGKLKKKESKLIVDVQDVWPESISSFLPFCSKIPVNFFPYSGKANAVYSSADALIAVSQTYLTRACTFSGNDH